MTEKKNKPIEGEIVTPDQLDRILGRVEQEPEIPQLDAILDRYDQLLRQSLEVLNLDKEEGWLGEFWGGLDYRIPKKSERGRAMFDLISTFNDNLDQLEKTEQKIRGINQAKYDRHLDRIRAARTVLEETQKLEAVAANARLQRQLEEAKVEADVEKYKKQVRDLRTPPQPPAPKPEVPRVDEYQRKREEAQSERKLQYELKVDAAEAEEEYQDQLTKNVMTRILKVFADPTTGRASKRMRIRNLIDTYGVVDDLLPAGVVELMEEEE